MASPTDIQLLRESYGAIYNNNNSVGIQAFGQGVPLDKPELSRRANLTPIPRSRMVLMADATNKAGGASCRWNGGYGTAASANTDSNDFSNLTFHHLNRANGVMFDGHAETISLQNMVDFFRPWTGTVSSVTGQAFRIFNYRPMVGAPMIIRTL